MKGVYICSIRDKNGGVCSCRNIQIKGVDICSILDKGEGVCTGCKSVRRRTHM